MVGVFSKEEYWKQRNAKPEDRRLIRRMARFEKTPIIAHHDRPDWPSKPVSKKAVLKQTKRYRKSLIKTAAVING